MENSKNKNQGILFWVLLTVLIIALGFIISSGLNLAAEIKYKQDISQLSEVTLKGAADSETCLNLSLSVWNNSIHQTSNKKTDKFTKNNKGKFYSDFNDALSKLYKDKDYSNTIDQIKANREQALEIMRKLSNPPKKYEKAFEEIKGLYTSYLDLTNLAISNSGSYNSVSADYTSYDAQYAKYYEYIRIYY